MERTSRIASLVLSAIVVSATAHAQTVRIDVSPLGAPADRQSLYPVVSYDGRYVAFHSDASNISPPELAGSRMNNVFVHDTQTGVTVQVSRGVGNVAANGASLDVVMSPDGGWVGFTSEATNLTSSPDTNGVRDVFVAHWRTGDVLRVRPRDGEANQASAVGVLSWDARDVVFCSTASNLGPGLTAAGAKTVVWNRLSGAITSAKPAAPATSSDCGFSWLETGISRRGRYITTAGIGGIVVHNRDTGQTLPLDNGAAWHEASGTGGVVVFGRDNGVYAWTAPLPPDGLLPATDSDSDGLPDI
jgi:TolB protein